MSGLYERALTLLNGGKARAQAAPVAHYDPDSGISSEEHQAILAEIEKEADENKLAVGARDFVLKAERKGVLMPLLVNLLAVALLAVGGIVLYYFFQRGESTLKEETLAVASAEGKLIEQFKKESEEKLLAKNREISQIQGQLSEIDQQRRDLAANMDAKVSAREQELRRGMEAALEEEREKLRRQGVSEQDINRRLAALESRKTTEFEAQLAAFTRQAEGERLASEKNLQAMQQEFQATLARASEERQQVLADSQQREAELKSRLEARTAALEEESRQARQDLARLSEQREKEQLASGQLIGFYSRVKADLQAGSLRQALADLDGVRQYLNDPAIAGLPAIQQRREVELFVLDSLGTLVRGEMRKTEADTASLVAAANLLAGLRKRVQDADALLAAGNTSGAQTEYGQALALVPEVDKAHRYLLERQEREAAAALAAAETREAAASREAAEARAAAEERAAASRAGQAEGARAAADAEEQARRAALHQALAAGQAAFEARDYAAAAERYAAALSYLPEEPAVVQRLAGQLRQAGYELGAAKQKRQDSAAAAAPLAEANRLYSQGRYTESIGAYSGVVERFPAASQVRDALQGIARAAEALNRPAGAGTGDSQGLREQLAQSAAEAQELKSSLARVQKDLRDREALSQSLQKERQMLSQEVASLKSEIASLKKTASEAAAAAPQADEAMKQKLARLQAIESRYNQIVDNYRQYVAQEDSLVLARGEKEGLTLAKHHLDTFLISTQESFPRFWDRIKRYDALLLNDGRSDALEDVSDVLYELSVRSNAQERRQFLDAEIQHRRNDPLMARLLSELKGL